MRGYVWRPASPLSHVTVEVFVWSGSGVRLSQPLGTGVSLTRGRRPARCFYYTASSMVAASAEPFLRVARRARRFVSRPKPVNSMDLLQTKVAQRDSYLVDPASSHMLVSKIKPCMSKYILLHSETANGSLNQLWFLRSYNPTWITVAILELIHATKLRPSGKSAFIRSRPIRDHSSRAPFLW